MELNIAVYSPLIVIEMLTIKISLGVKNFLRLIVNLSALILINLFHFQHTTQPKFVLI